MATFNQPNQKVGTQYNVDGDFHQDNSNRSINISGGNVGMVNTGDQAEIVIDTQNIGNISGMGDGNKAELAQLVERLKAELQKASAAQQTQAKEIAELTESLLEQAAADNPKQSVLKVTANGLLEAAKAVAGIMPVVGKVVPQIVELVAG
jgi:ElaB/YqjD/DUF883 family membrane-anchored ribosome-binding protein